MLAKALTPLALAASWSATRAPVSVPLTVLALVGLSGCGLLYLVNLKAGNQAGAGDAGS